MPHKKEIILVNVSGSDKPGLTVSLTSILSAYNANILDIGQAVIHNVLSLGILFEISETDKAAPILKDLLYKSYELDVTLKFTPISEDHYSNWVSQQGKNRYIITLLGRRLSAYHISVLTKILFEQNLNIDIITRLSGRIPLEPKDKTSRACVEFSVRGTPVDLEKMKQQFLEVSQNTGIDIGFQVDNIYRRNRRLVCFDMDSTLIQTEVIVELAKIAGAGDEVHEITERTMRGEIDFNESFKQRIKHLKGIDESKLHEIAIKLPLTEGADRLIRTLKQYGYKTAILSGGFTFFGRYLQVKLGIDYVFANELEIKDGKLTGNYLGEIIDGQKKAEMLRKLAFKEDIDINQVIAIGDGVNDLPMLNIAGLGIAFHAKPRVKENAEQAISTLGLDSVLYLIGFRDREI